MIILQINATYGIGSTGVIVKDLQQMIEQKGHTCYVACYQSAVTDSPFIIKVGNCLTEKWHALMTRFTGKQAYSSQFQTWRLLRRMDRMKPDVVHLHNLHSNFINFPMLTKYLADHSIRTLVTMHDCWFYTGGCCHYTNAGCYRWKEGCGNCPGLRRINSLGVDATAKVLKDRVRLLGAIPDCTLVGVSKWIADEAKHSMVKPKVKVTYIHNGVDFETFKPVESDIRDRLGIGKRFMILAPASKWLDPVNSDALRYFTAKLSRDEVLVLFGCNDHDNNLPTNVIQYGFTRNRNELAKLYTAADVFVNLTHEDSLPSINLEAQACGTRVLTYANTGTRETVDEINSFGVEDCNYEQMFRMVQEMKEHPSSPQDIIDWVKRGYEKNDNYGKYMKLYLE